MLLAISSAALGIALAGCAAPQKPQLTAIAEADRSVVKVMTVREIYGSRAGRVKLSVFDYGDECPPERNRTSSHAFRGSTSVSQGDTDAELPVSGGSATLIRVYEKQKTSRLGHVTCDVGFWFTPDSQAEYVLQYSNRDGNCSVSLVNARSMEVVPINRPGTCTAELLAKKRERMGDLSLRSGRSAR